LDPPDQASAQTQPATGSGQGRVRDSFDFGWKFLKGDVVFPLNTPIERKSRGAPVTASRRL
jgi:hypothetical protein